MRFYFIAETENIIKIPEINILIVLSLNLYSLKSGCFNLFFY